MHFHKVQKEFTRLVRKLALSLDAYNTREKVELYTQALIEKDYSVEEMNKLVEHCLVSLAKFPTLPQLVSIATNMFGAAKKEKDLDYQEELTSHKVNMYKKDTNHLKQEFIKAYGEDKLNEWLLAWYNAVYPGAQLKTFGFGVSLLMPVFLQDLSEGKTLEGTIKITRKKNEGKGN